MSRRIKDEAPILVKVEQVFASSMWRAIGSDGLLVLG